MYVTHPGPVDTVAVAPVAVRLLLLYRSTARLQDWRCQERDLHCGRVAAPGSARVRLKQPEIMQLEQGRKGSADSRIDIIT